MSADTPGSEADAVHVANGVGAPGSLINGKAPRPVIQLEGIVRTYQMGDVLVHALRGVSLRVERGEFVAIMGQSGSGKSTMMNILGCLDVPNRGRYLLDGVDVSKLDEATLARARNRKIGFIFQSFNLIPRTSALANVELPMAYAGVRPKERLRRAKAALEMVGLGSRMHHLPNELSGGQQQRAAVARAIATNPSLILADEPTGNLDTQSSDDVMAIFSRLNAQGRTVVLITHEQEIADYTQRTVRLRDGRIIHDSAAPGALPYVAAGGSVDYMSPLENIRISLRGLRGNKLRSSLTVLGILIGVGAVIILVAVGNGSSAAVQSQIKALGTNTVTVMSTGRFGRGPATTGTQSQSATLTEADVKLLEDQTQAPDVLTASPVVSTSESATFSSASGTITVTGTTTSYVPAEGYSIEAGRNLTSADVSSHALVAVVGQTLISDLFTTGINPIGQQIQMGAAQWTIVGVLASKGSTGTTDENAVAVVPYTSAEDQLTGYTASFNELIVESKNSHDVDAAEAETETILASANKTTVADLPFRLLNESSLLQTSQSTNETFTVLLGAVAAISLLVGGIGIMNIMLVTVTERTREIGIRKAIGAPKSAILSQFLTEAVILSFLGGVAGVIVGLIGSHFKIVGIKPVVSGTSIVEAFGVAIAIGIFFGFYPANRAASMRPIDALRYE